MSCFEQSVLRLFEATRAEWLATAREAAHRLASERGCITIDDVREACPPPEDVDPRVMGAVFRRSEFQRVAYRQSRRARCHFRPVAVFQLRVNRSSVRAQNAGVHRE
jgi:hypothetical protein